MKSERCIHGDTMERPKWLGGKDKETVPPVSIDSSQVTGRGSKRFDWKGALYMGIITGGFALTFTGMMSVPDLINGTVPFVIRKAPELVPELVPIAVIVGFSALHGGVINFNPRKLFSWLIYRNQ